MQPIISGIITHSHTLHILTRNVHSSLAYKWLLALGRSRVKPHALHFAGSIVFTAPKNIWGILQIILQLLATPNIGGWENQSSGARLRSSRYALAP